MNKFEETLLAVRDEVVRVHSAEAALKGIVEYFLRVEQRATERGFWRYVRDNLAAVPVGKVVGWARRGLESLIAEETADWNVLYLNLGEVPELFLLVRAGEDGPVPREPWRHLIARRGVLDAHQHPLDVVLSSTWTLAYHHTVRETHSSILLHPLRTPTEPELGVPALGAAGFEGSYFLWFGLASAALLEPLQDHAYCGRVTGYARDFDMVVGFSC